MKIEWKNKQINYILISTIFFPIMSWIILFMGIFVGMTFEQALAGGGPYISEILIYIANWPSFLLKIYPYLIDLHGVVVYDVGRGIFNPLVIFVNTIGWALIGTIVGLIISMARCKKVAEPKSISMMDKTIKILYYIAVTFWCFSILSSLVFGLIFGTIAWRPSIHKSFINSFMRIVGFFFIFIIPLIFTASFAIAMIIIIKNIKGRFLNKQQQILLWIIILSFIIVNFFYFRNIFIF